MDWLKILPEWCALSFSLVSLGMSIWSFRYRFRKSCRANIRLSLVSYPDGRYTKYRLRVENTAEAEARNVSLSSEEEGADKAAEIRGFGDICPALQPGDSFELPFFIKMPHPSFMTVTAHWRDISGKKRSKDYSLHLLLVR